MAESTRDRILDAALRAYGTDGNFDETKPQPLWIRAGSPSAGHRCF